jgi:hypothetical protein
MRTDPTMTSRFGGAVGRVTGAARVLTRHSNWNIGIVDRPVATLLDDRLPVEPTWLPTRPGHYAGDPFGLQRGSRLEILFEDFDQRRSIGKIGHVSVAADGTTSEPEIVLDPGCHTSYPFLIEAEGEVWMVPETADLSELRLYLAVEFPRRWRLETTLLRDVPVSDATIVERDGAWWLFGTSRGMGVNEALRVWHAPKLTGPWTIHATDPVKVDARSARPGGTPFVVDDVLYRPAQDCSRRYGGRTVINRVATLNAREFAESAAAVVAPDAGSRYRDGLHTVSAVGSRTLIDGNAVHFVPDAARAAIRRRLSR